MAELEGGGRTDGQTAACLERDEWRTFSDLMGGGRRTAEGEGADQGMKKSVVGIKPNGSCYFFLPFFRMKERKESETGTDRLD